MHNFNGLEQGNVNTIDNDIEMVQWAGLGAAMGNAVPELKDCADVVMPSNNDDGLAAFVDHIIALNEQHLRRILQDYVNYHEQDRLHDSLQKDAPNRRAEGNGREPMPW